MGSTDRRHEPVRTTKYLVSDWVRVRQEDFGLLFYDTRSARLTFVRSGDSLVPPPFNGPGRNIQVAPVDGADRPEMERLLRSLVAKGLIYASEAD